MATFRKRGPYQWEAQIRKRGYPAQSKTFNTKAEAEAWAKMIESEMARGVWISRGEAESTTMREALERYQAEIVPHKKGKVQEASVIKTLLALPLALRPLASVRGADLACLRDAWLKDYAPATVLRRLAVVSHVFSVARKEWGMESLSNPVEVMRKPVVKNARVRRVVELDRPPEDAEGENDARVVRDGELDWVIAASNSALLPSIIRLAVETAMRRGEIVGLRWEHIDLERRVAHLPATKNGSARDVPLSSTAVAVLQGLWEGLDAKGRGAGPVFGIRADGVTRAFERAVERARTRYEGKCRQAEKRPLDGFLVDFRFHDLRHEATSRLASIFPMHELTKITGHKDPRMLMRYYHPKAEELAKRLG
ncbi:site-specific integrase [Achromobacter xylosoxidans]|uniref:site-specific integrase n=1 Tax=Alcaligenes xylosoxydans xylosoxydans TaxID=85698 RepID=UPI00292F61BC|nr:site-specific integrase [Achromobacter xylosoxidans]WOB76265.1 site-specific integrase [Achromobacter xylosoxidans]